MADERGSASVFEVGLFPTEKHQFSGVGLYTVVDRLRLEDIQRFLHSRWEAWALERGRPEAARGVGMCRFSSFFLATILGGPWHVEDGEQHYDWSSRSLIGTGGYFDGKVWNGHYWVTDGRLIVDLAAGQFGGESIQVAAASDERYAANYLS